MDINFRSMLQKEGNNCEGVMRTVTGNDHMLPQSRISQSSMMLASTHGTDGEKYILRLYKLGE